MRKIDALCTIPECGKPHHSKSFCRSHYRKFYENKKRYQKVKSDPTLSQKTKEAVNKYRKSDVYKEKRKEHDKKYYIENKETINKYKRSWNEKRRFGIPRIAVLYRDGQACVLCSSEEDLVVHHKNNKGRSVEVPDNNPNNLITLCRSCHMRIHRDDLVAGKIRHD